MKPTKIFKEETPQATPQSNGVTGKISVSMTKAPVLSLLPPRHHRVREPVNVVASRKRHSPDNSRDNAPDLIREHEPSNRPQVRVSWTNNYSVDRLPLVTGQYTFNSSMPLPPNEQYKYPNSHKRASAPPLPSSRRHVSPGIDNRASNTAEIDI